MNQPIYARPDDGLRRQLTLTWVLLGLLIVLFVLPSIRAWLGFGFNSGTPRTITPRGELADFEKSTIELFDAASPSVVFVNVSTRVRSPFSLSGVDVEAGTGSGFIWDNAGHVVTNFHVIQNASSANVVMYDQSTFQASLVGVSPDHDLAVLKIRATAAQIRPLAIGESGPLAVGQSVFAIGNPFGLNHTLTTGVVSAKSRMINGPSGRAIENVIQIDAAINPGNSGGPLLDSAGRLIGVNTAIYSPSGTSAGVGFAVPVDTVNRVVPQLIANGRYEPPRVLIKGIGLGEIRTNLQGVKGILVLAVKPGSGADEAGLRGTESGAGGVYVLGDIIQAVAGREVADMNDLALAIDPFASGEIVEMQVLRNGEPIEIRVRLD